MKGFTLVEMMVALLIFGLVAAAGVSVMGVSVDARQAVQSRTGELGAFQRARALLAEVEARLAATYADLAAEVTGGQRRNAVLSACECSVRSIAWGATTAAFPGR